MRKGKFGILLSYYAVLAFVLVILNQTLLCGLLFLTALLFEKDEWLGRQTLQALMLSLVVGLFSGVTNVLSSVFSSWIFNFAGIFSVISSLVWIAAVVFSIIAIVNCLKDRDAGVPIIADVAYKAYGQQKLSYKPPVPVPPASYYQQQNYQQQPTNPVQPPYPAAKPNIPPQQFHTQNPPPVVPTASAAEPHGEQPPTSPPTQI